MTLGPDGQPIGVRPAKREQKRKMPARYEDAPPSPAPPQRREEGVRAEPNKL